MRRSFAILGSAAVAVAGAGFLASPASAACSADNANGIVDAAGLAYVAVDSNTGVWLYLESNGESGLQRGSRAGFLETGDGSGTDCGGSENPDTIIF